MLATPARKAPDEQRAPKREHQRQCNPFEGTLDARREHQARRDVIVPGRDDRHRHRDERQQPGRASRHGAIIAGGKPASNRACDEDALKPWSRCCVVNAMGLALIRLVALLGGSPEIEAAAHALPPAEADRAEPATRAARKVMRRLEKLDREVQTTRYQHRTVIRRSEGHYAWDCSAMVTWILKRTAPTALAAIDKDRPVAVSYVRIIKKAPTRRSREGWRRVPHIDDVRPGDVFAWKRPPGFPSKNTGHVGFVLDVPKPLPHNPSAYKVRIADASSYRHEDDSRAPGGEGGYGTGTILFLTDGHGQGIAYGWYGNETRLIETPIYFGRVTK